MNQIPFEDVQPGKEYSIIFLPGRDAEEFFKATIKAKNDFCAVGVIDRRILTKFGSEILKGQLINLFKTKTIFMSKSKRHQSNILNI